MADIKLGLYGAEVTLPQVNVPVGSRPSMPRAKPKQIDFETMLDGSCRGNAKEYSPQSFSLSWAQLSAADVATIETEANRNVRLHYQNAWHSVAWYWVGVVDFKADPVVYLGTVLYGVSLELREVGP
ncbi:MAG: hypothetical protein IMZ54_11795 [Acidobacteria bacterium]|nr:hypothetical protein [Acidobacteriota bacterium]